MREGRFFFSTHAPRRLGLLAVHLGKHLAEQHLKRLVLGSLVELAQEMPSWLEGLGREGEGGMAEVLFCGAGKGREGGVVSFCVMCQGLERERERSERWRYIPCSLRGP